MDENREHFSWGKPEEESIREYAKKTFGWTKKRTDEIIMPVIKRLNEKTSQQTIQNYFKITDIKSRRELKVSKRVRLALHQMSGDPDSSIVEEETIEKKKPKKRQTTKKSTKKSNECEFDNAGDELIATVDDVIVLPDTQSETEVQSKSQSNEQIEVKTKNKPKQQPQPTQKMKPKRKRKAAQPVEQVGNDDSDVFALTPVNTSTKKIILPDNNAPIPQREKDKQIAESNRLKAIEVMKKTKTGKKK